MAGTTCTRRPQLSSFLETCTFGSNLGERPVSEKINHNRRHFLGIAAVTIAATMLGIFNFAKAQFGKSKIGRSTYNQGQSRLHQMMPGAVQLPVEGNLPSLGGATEWLNSPPLTMADLRGKVILLDFWTYTCINWIRTLPYARPWAERYKDQDLLVIGVHSPEFSFERNVANVRRAVTDMRVDYPIVIDNDFAIWRAFDNHYWPALYLIDAQGQIRHHHFGEGEYEQL